MAPVFFLCLWLDAWLDGWLDGERSLLCILLLIFLLACLLSGYVGRASAAKRSEAVAVPFFPPCLLLGWMDGLMDGWMVRSLLAPSVHPFAYPSSPSYPSPPSSCLFACLLAHWTVRAQRSRARALWFLLLLLLLLLLLWPDADTTCDELWRTVGTIVLSVSWLRRFLVI